MLEKSVRQTSTTPGFNFPAFPSGAGGATQPGMSTFPYPTPGGQTVPTGPLGTFIPGTPTGISTGVNVPGQLPVEQSYIENILRLNIGKMGTFYMTYENNSQWNAKIFKGRIEAAGRDHIIISDPATGMRFLLLMVNLDYVTFDEPLNYYYPFPQTRK